ncbi:MAG: hypothetical protein BWZ02_02463 [Lentisphaerae bacterium ADurb.BinA184]|nr:MAG: hypothetical protein BWZ02_02463 [Lentisphaerae bacterium ADurb.BinA184]
MSTARRLAKCFTYADSCAWPDGERWELIGGQAFAMSPAPNVRHRRILLELGVALRRHFPGKTCEAFVSPRAAGGHRPA